MTGLLEDLQIDTRDCTSHFTESGPLQCKEVMELLSMRRRHLSRVWNYTQRWILRWIHQDKTFLSWDTTNNGTFSKCGLPLSIILSHSFSSMYISLYKLLDPWFSNVIFHNFLIYYLYLKAHSKNELLFLHGSGSSKFRIIGCEFILRNKLNNDICIISPPI